MTRLPVPAIVLLAVIAFPGSGCAPPQQQAVPRGKITVAYSVNLNPSLVYVALAKGYLAEEGLDAKPQPHAFGKLALEAVIDGKADLATVADTPFVFAVLNGREITTVAEIQTSNRNEAIVARRDRGIARPADLKGRTIGITPGTSSDYFAYAFLLFHGIDGNQVKRIDMKPEEMADALGTGTVDAVSTWNPNLKRLQKMLGSGGATYYGEGLYTETFCVAGQRDFVKENPETVKKVLRALIRAEAFVKRHPEDSRRLVADFIKVDKDVVDEVWDDFTFKVGLDQALLVDLEDQTRWAIRKGLTARRDMPNYLDFIDVDPLQSVKPEAARIVR